jgi:transposase
VFDFTLRRTRDGPQEFLKDYKQVLLADAYGGYNGVVAGNAITRAGCWSHARRKFIEAEKTAPEIAREAWPCCAGCLRWKSRPRNFPSPNV